MSYPDSMVDSMRYQIQEQQNEIESLRQQLDDVFDEKKILSQRVKGLELLLKAAENAYAAELAFVKVNAEEELAALKQSQGEPVAYLVYSPTRHEQEFLYEDELGYEEGSEITPLYTSAPTKCVVESTTIPKGLQMGDAFEVWFSNVGKYYKADVTELRECFFDAWSEHSRLQTIPEGWQIVETSVWNDAIEFVDRHSESWYLSGQELLARMKEAPKPEDVKGESVGEVFGNRIKWSVKAIPIDGTKLYTSALTIPEGWKIVPIEFTREFEATFRKYHGARYSWSRYALMNLWDSLLAAAPKPEDVK